ncbi:hypothetical protein TYRP_017324 [Tyrophagus putrescentiae]|nr:hypothetical protein TYRP_017324 [Tyrophagus putrescentiae]
MLSGKGSTGLIRQYCPLIGSPLICSARSALLTAKHCFIDVRYVAGQITATCGVIIFRYFSTTCSIRSAANSLLFEACSRLAVSSRRVFISLSPSTFSTAANSSASVIVYGSMCQCHLLISKERQNNQRPAKGERLSDGVIAAVRHHQVNQRQQFRLRKEGLAPGILRKFIGLPQRTFGDDDLVLALLAERAQAEVDHLVTGQSGHLFRKRGNGSGGVLIFCLSHEGVHSDVVVRQRRIAVPRVVQLLQFLLKLAAENLEAVLPPDGQVLRPVLRTVWRQFSVGVSPWENTQRLGRAEKDPREVGLENGRRHDKGVHHKGVRPVSAEDGFQLLVQRRHRGEGLRKDVDALRQLVLHLLENGQRAEEARAEQSLRHLLHGVLRWRGIRLGRRGLLGFCSRRLGQVNHDGPIAETLIGVSELGLCRDEGHLVAAGQQGLQGPHAAQHVAHALHGVGVDSQLPLGRGGGGGVL